MAADNIKETADELIALHFSVLPNHLLLDHHSSARSISTMAAITTVEFALKQVPMYTGELNPKWEELNDLLTELKSR